MTYPLYECFLAFQGEGVHMGRSAFFVRTYGCPVHCPFCDSAGTWHKDWIPAGIQRVDAWNILQQIKEGPRPEFVVVTGGEPAIHNLNPFTELMHDNDFKVHLETSGAFDIQGKFDWITLSPKKWKMPLRVCVDAASEFKFIIESKEDIDYYFNAIAALAYPWTDIPTIWLHPEWSKREDPVVLGAISDAVKEGEGRFRAGYQLHKVYMVDSRDIRSRALVPLGGDLNKGY